MSLYPDWNSKYDYVKRLKKNKGLQMRRHDLMDKVFRRNRVTYDENVIKRRAPNFVRRVQKNDKGRLMPIVDGRKSGYGKGEGTSPGALPRCPVCGKILFINGKCPDMCRF